MFLDQNRDKKYTVARSLNFSYQNGANGVGNGMDDGANDGTNKGKGASMEGGGGGV